MATNSSSTSCFTTSNCAVMWSSNSGRQVQARTSWPIELHLAAVDAQIKHPQDAPTIGLLLCKSKNKVVAEYALRNNTQPLGVAEYQLLDALPAELQTSLPSIEQIERELARSWSALHKALNHPTHGTGSAPEHAPISSP